MPDKQPKIVKVDGIGIVKFPDHMSDQAISIIIQNIRAKNQSSPATSQSSQPPVKQSIQSPIASPPPVTPPSEIKEEEPKEEIKATETPAAESESSSSESEDVFHPTTHAFSLSAWREANPSGNADAAKIQAEHMGYEVVD